MVLKLNEIFSCETIVMKLLLTFVLILPNILIGIVWNKKDICHIKTSDLKKELFLVRLVTSTVSTGVP